MRSDRSSTSGTFRVIYFPLLETDESAKLQDNHRLVLHGDWSPFVKLGPSSPSSPPVTEEEDHPLPIRSSPVGYIDHLAILHSTDRQAWRRFLPPNAILTLPGQDMYDPTEHDKLLNLFFQFFSSWGFRVSPSLFWRDMREALSPHAPPSALRTAHYSPFLHNSILAIATALSDYPQIKADANRLMFADAAKSVFEDECKRPTISTVSGFSFLSSFHSGRNEHALGFVYIGLSVRMTRALGLNINCSHWVKSGHITQSDMRDRYWGFWTTYSQDVWWSLYVGREFSINLSHVVLPLPSYDNLPEDDTPWVLPGIDETPIPNLRRDVFIHTCRLTVIATRIMDLIYGLNRRSGPSHQYLSTLRLEIQDWLQNIPPELAATDRAIPNVMMMHITTWWLIILLERPFYSFDPDCVSRKWCLRAVDHILKIVRNWKIHYTLRYSPITLASAIFGAATTNLLAISKAPPKAAKTREKYRAGVQECVHYLQDIGETWECGKQIAQILIDLLNEKGCSVVPEDDSPTGSIPSEQAGMSNKWGLKDAVPSIQLNQPSSQYQFMQYTNSLQHVPNCFPITSTDNGQAPDFPQYPNTFNALMESFIPGTSADFCSRSGEGISNIPFTSPVLGTLPQWDAGLDYIDNDFDFGFGGDTHASSMEHNYSGFH
ncbi:hypothetical protein SISSUDRAFT_774606 [Sistotremastrum suecicum HHB10207 ss-3]|uniref:Xylanolytic transcriptional activator regulatory domain-containing protein n=1 Tax=Sistotremastrum suecicum HHB10207 ss-3 TaxID=1314776 RepID=A0A166D8H2_9AGAM|nr:hypothetical protein SISSUDRAFT_774606 [Sistotremastrum suecicum HHB10207 ss-3]